MDGKAPSGYGLGELGKTVYSLSEITKSGFYTVISDEMLNANGWYGYITMSSANYGAGLLSSNGLFAFVSKSGGVWQPVVECTPSVFAPAGFGLGLETPQRVGSADNAISNGWYIVDDPGGVGSGWLYCASYSNNYKYQEFYNVGSGQYRHLERWLYGNGWSEWEWVNPPMVKGVEYRTTKRYKGIPVYTRLVNLGWLGAGEHKFNLEDIPVTSTTTGLYISMINNNHELVSDGAGVTNRWLGRSDGYLTIRFTLAVAHGDIDAYIEYTK